MSYEQGQTLTLAKNERNRNGDRFQKGEQVEVAWTSRINGRHEVVAAQASDGRELITLTPELHFI